MSCSNQGTRQILSYYSKYYGVSFKEVTRFFHWAKADNETLLTSLDKDTKTLPSKTEAKKWLLRQQNMVNGTPGNKRLLGLYASRYDKMLNGENPLRVSEMDAIDSLPTLLTLRSVKGYCRMCGMEDITERHDCLRVGRDKIGWLSKKQLGWPMNPVQAAAWWSSLPPEVKEGVLRRYPEELGAMDGLPSAVRDRSNRLVLANAKARLENLLAEEGSHLETTAVYRALSPFSRKQAVNSLRTQLDIVNSVDRALRSYPDNARLLHFEAFPTPGKAVVALGDTDTADNITVLVSGMNSYVSHALDHVLANASSVRMQQRMYNTFLRGRNERMKNNVTVAWLGYHPPNVGSVLFKGHALKGAPDLKNFLVGLRAGRDNQEDLHLTLIGHSYGSVVSSLAARKKKNGAGDENPMFVNNLAFIGSPGVTVKNIEEFKAHQGHVFTGAADGDFVTWFPVHGRLPHSKEFKSLRFETDSSTDFLGRETEKVSGHSDYYKDGSSSLMNLALIGLGENDRVVMRGQKTSSLDRVSKTVVS